jgi:hypothetical protein
VRFDCWTQVESYEEGDLISNYVNDPSNQHNVALADIGLTSYLQMLLHDNFIHAGGHDLTAHFNNPPSQSELHGNRDSNIT